MFLGDTSLNLDAKGRLAIPAKYRGGLVDCCASRLVVTASPWDACLWLYPYNEWSEIARSVSRLPEAVPANRDVKRMVLGHAADLEMDGQGRVLLPASLREYADMEKAVMLVGQFHKCEIWSADAWAEKNEEIRAAASRPDSELSEELRNLSF